MDSRFKVPGALEQGGDGPSTVIKRQLGRMPRLLYLPILFSAVVAAHAADSTISVSITSQTLLNVVDERYINFK